MTSAKDFSREEWPLKAYKNLEFLNSDAARNLRVLCEMTEPGHRFAKESIEDTIVLFGSARLQSEARAREALETLRASFENPEAPTESEKFSLLRAEFGIKSAKYYTAAAELSEELTRWSLKREAEGKSPYTICSGGGPGIMEAANYGAKKAGGKSIGLGISLPFEQGVNDSVPEELKFEFHYFFVRKFWFVSMAKVLVAFPGGFGTLDELFETLTLVQTKKIREKPVIVLFGSEFWNSVINFETLVEWGVISPKDIDLFKIIDDVGEAAEFIIEGLTGR
jgi:uncharacterized protein (TIGR00730 family)